MKYGIRSLSYKGVTADNPPNMFIFQRDPLAKDYKGFEHGDIWLNELLKKIFILVSKKGRTGTWKEFQTFGGGGGLDILSVTTDDGLSSSGDVNGIITVSGGSNIETYRIGANEYGIKTPANVTFGGTVTATAVSGGLLTGAVITGLALINRGVVRATITGTLYASKGNDGEVLVGGTGVDSEWANITAGTGIVVTNGSNTIDISVGETGGGGADGEVLISAIGAQPIWANLTAGAGIVITNTPNGIEIKATSAGNDLPIGTILENADGPPPGGSWLDCDGSSVLQATYPELFAAIGHRYMRPSFVEQTHPFTTLPGGTTGLLCCAHNGLTGVDSLWVVAGKEKNLGYSQDGITWTNVGPTYLGAKARIVSVAHNRQAGVNGLWALVYGYDGVAPHTFVIKTSPDGIIWTNAYTSSVIDVGPGSKRTRVLTHNGLASPNGLWVVKLRVGNGPTVPCKYLTSPDGITWTERSLPVTYRESIGGIAFKDNVWVVTTDDSYPNGSFSTSLYTSTDGALTWERTFYQSVTADKYRGFWSITASDDVFMASMGNHNLTLDEIYVSEDGFGWDTYQSPLGFERNGYPKCLAYNDDVWMAGLYTTGKVASTMDYKGDWDLSINTTPVGGRSTIQDISSNHTPAEDSKWLFVCYHSNLTHIFLGGPAINTTTHFYLPNIPGSIILY